MARNVEIKARVRDRPALVERIERVATAGPDELRQHDVFFDCHVGRLKLRRFADGGGELIAYQRADREGPETSRYQLVSCAEPEDLEAALTEALGVLGEVRKRRTLWLVGRTRIHLDEVEGLGTFVELEVVLAEGASAREGEAEAAELMARLGIEDRDLVSTAYVDLLAAARPS